MIGVFNSWDALETKLFRLSIEEEILLDIIFIFFPSSFNSSVVLIFTSSEKSKLVICLATLFNSKIFLVIFLAKNLHRKILKIIVRKNVIKCNEYTSCL